MEKKKKSANGASQRACLFKIDNELLGWLEKQPNKGRYVNELIKRDMLAGGGNYDAALEAEKARQAADTETESIDADAIMGVLVAFKNHHPATVLLFKRAGKYDALYSDARTVKRIVPSARITTAELEGLKIENCFMARIDDRQLYELEQETRYCIINYPKK